MFRTLFVVLFLGIASFACSENANAQVFGQSFGQQNFNQGVFVPNAFYGVPQQHFYSGPYQSQFQNGRRYVGPVYYPGFGYPNVRHFNRRYSGFRVPSVQVYRTPSRSSTFGGAHSSQFFGNPHASQYIPR